MIASSAWDYGMDVAAVLWLVWLIKLLIADRPASLICILIELLTSAGWLALLVTLRTSIQAKINIIGWLVPSTSCGGTYAMGKTRVMQMLRSTGWSTNTYWWRSRSRMRTSISLMWLISNISKHVHLKILIDCWQSWNCFEAYCFLSLLIVKLIDFALVRASLSKSSDEQLVVGLVEITLWLIHSQNWKQFCTCKPSTK